MPIAPGDKAPGFSLESQFGENIELATLLEGGPVALVFFPLAFTGICTGELCELRDNLAVFDDAGVQLVAISVDSKATLRAFAEREGFEFTLLADFWPHGAVAREYGVFLEERGVATRATFVIRGDGVVSGAFMTAPGEARDLAAYREAVSALA
ncbi:peroxiredoxin [Salinibacterium sp. SYSU T00001]|uniref:peroxiredoxin n=1 Tax=Homoserinimonas sedimenticola TaxID=2986805 RepID=UPI002235A94D|nr:peroxiredoxin [Salinibacterium sedimenticola]MCW4384539.1 peroxiredoxin [Salinibacterium sedimenticola]